MILFKARICAWTFGVLPTSGSAPNMAGHAEAWNARNS